MLRSGLVALALLVVAPLLSGCLGAEPSVALLLADGSDTSSRAVDVDRFTERVEAACAECRVQVLDAEGDAAVQKSQARQVEADSADVVVVVPVDAGDLATLTGDNVPVLALGERVRGADAFVGLNAGPASVEHDDDLSAARDVLLGEAREMTYVPMLQMSDQAADVAVGLLADSPVEGGEVIDGTNSWVYEPQQVTLDSLTTVLVGQGVLTLDQLCEGETAQRCTRLGLR